MMNEHASVGVLSGISSARRHIGVGSSYGAFIAPLSHITSRLHAIAQKQGAVEIADKVSELSTIIETDVDPHGIFRVANELLELCRSTQAAILRLAESDHPPSAPEGRQVVPQVQGLFHC